MAGEASSTEESERIGIFPDAASSVGSHRLAMLATAFLASEKIPMILSDNGRRGLTLETRERRRRQIEIFLRSGVLGCSALKAELRIEGHGCFFSCFCGVWGSCFCKKELRKRCASCDLLKKCRELCMALTVASRHYVPKAPVRLHKRHLCSILNSQISILSCKSQKHDVTAKAKNRLMSDV